MTGIDWILVPSHDFETTVAFFENTMGFAIEAQGRPTHDHQYARYVTFRTANGVVLEVVEPTGVCEALYTHPLVCISVPDLNACRTALEAEGTEFLTDTIETNTGAAWAYFRTPEGTPTQICADPNAPQTKPVSKHGEGVAFILAPSNQFDDTVGFFKRHLHLNLTVEGVPVTDKRFSRYALFGAANGVELEVVEPTKAHAEQFTHPVVSITVPDLVAMTRHLRANGITLLSDIVDTGEGWGWVYFMLPGASMFQLGGPC